MVRPRRALLLASLVLAGCGGGSDTGDGEAVLTIYVSAPLAGPAQAEGERVADGARLALAEAGAEVDRYTIEVEVLDSSDGPRGWTPTQAAANARAAIRDSTAIAYVGELEAGATRASLPITNQARLLQVSPGEGADDLAAIEPSGEPSFALAGSGRAAMAAILEALGEASDAGDREAVIDAYLDRDPGTG